MHQFSMAYSCSLGTENSSTCTSPVACGKISRSVHCEGLQPIMKHRFLWNIHLLLGVGRDEATLELSGDPLFVG